MQDLKNIYSITDKTMSASNSSTYLDAGKHNNIELKEIKKGVAKNGSDFMAIYFENEKGDKVSYTEFPLRFKKSFNEMTSEELTKSLKRVEYQMSRWKQICEVFKPNCKLVASSFSDFIDKTIEFLGNSYKGKKVRIKVIYDDRNYTTLANNPNDTFIESMDIPEELSKVRILPSDKLKREKPDVEKYEESKIENIIDSVDNTTEKSNSGTDDPF